MFFLIQVYKNPDQNWKILRQFWFAKSNTQLQWTTLASPKLPSQAAAI